MDRHPGLGKFYSRREPEEGRTRLAWRERERERAVCGARLGYFHPHDYHRGISILGSNNLPIMTHLRPADKAMLILRGLNYFPFSAPGPRKECSPQSSPRVPLSLLQYSTTQHHHSRVMTIPQYMKPTYPKRIRLDLPQSPHRPPAFQIQNNLLRGMAQMTQIIQRIGHIPTNGLLHSSAVCSH
jgi:hypothetical protein